MAKEQTDIGEERDRRIIERKLLRCQITEKELKKFLIKLPDVSTNAEQIVIEVEQKPLGSTK